MGKSIVCFIFLISISVNSFAVNGDTTRVADNILILKVWGTHQERGYAHGYILANEIKDIFEDYVLKVAFCNNPTFYNYARNFFITYFQVEQKYIDETNFMITGISDAGVSLYSPILGRDVDGVDILVSNSLDELRELFQCSSLSSWGISTQSDSILSGELVITRLMDWQLDENLVNNHLILVNIPSEVEEQNWVTVSYPGLIAALSAMNDSGVAAFKNVGNIKNHTNTTTFHPVLFSIRNGIELKDYNNDGVNNSIDILNSIANNAQYGASIIHVVSEVGSDSFALIIECNNEKGCTCRTTADNTQIPDYNLVATNVFRVLYSPVYCIRYDEIEDSFIHSSDITIERSWNLMAGACGYSTNNQMMQFTPHLKKLRFAGAKVGNPAYTQPIHSFLLDDLFVLTCVAEQPVDKPIQNILSIHCIGNKQVNVDFSLLEAQTIEIKLFDIMGRLISTPVSRYFSQGNHNIDFQVERNGIYFYRVEINRISERGKLIVF